MKEEWRGKVPKFRHIQFLPETLKRSSDQWVFETPAKKHGRIGSQSTLDSDSGDTILNSLECNMEP